MSAAPTADLELDVPPEQQFEFTINGSIDLFNVNHATKLFLLPIRSIADREWLDPVKGESPVCGYLLYSRGDSQIPRLVGIPSHLKETC